MIKCNKWEYQKKANIESFCEEREYRERKNILCKLAKNFEQKNIRWAIVCSLNLYLRGIVDDFNDIDLLVEAEDAKKIKETMIEFGADIVEVPEIDFCKSDIVMYFDLDKVRVEVISGFRILTFGTQYFYKYDSNEVETMHIEDIDVHLINLEALYLLYGMMEGWQQRRRYKRLLIQEYLMSEGLKFPNILKQGLEKDLPAWLKTEIRKIIA